MIRRASQFAVGVNARCPVPGRVKTRLCPPLTDAQAAEVYEAFVLDLVVRLENLEDVNLVMFFDPPSAVEWFRSRLGNRWEVIPQAEGSLGNRLQEESVWLTEHGNLAFVLLGSDAPTLPLSEIRGALDWLAAGSRRMAVGPDQDGGYYLVGLNGVVPGLFERVAWSTTKTLEDTVRNAEQAGLRVRHMAPWYDVDDIEALRRLGRELAAPAWFGSLVRTFAWIQSHARMVACDGEAK